MDALLAELRKEQVEDVKKVALSGFNRSLEEQSLFFLYPQYNPITQSNIHSNIEPFDFPKIIIKEKKINYDELHRLGKDEQWLLHQIKTTYNVSINDVLLATLENNDNLKVYLYK